jgi:hypothetical protein
MKTPESSSQSPAFAEELGPNETVAPLKRDVPLQEGGHRSQGQRSFLSLAEML